MIQTHIVDRHGRCDKEDVTSQEHAGEQLKQHHVTSCSFTRYEYWGLSSKMVLGVFARLCCAVLCCAVLGGAEVCQALESSSSLGQDRHSGHDGDGDVVY